MPRSFIPLSEWLPDQGLFGNPGLSVVKNWIPASAGKGSYVPRRKWLEFTSSKDLANASVLGVFLNQSDYGPNADFIYVGTNDATPVDQLIEYDIAADTFAYLHPGTLNTPGHFGWQFAGFGDVTIATPGRGAAGAGSAYPNMPLYQSAPGAAFAPLHDGTSDYEPSFHFVAPFGDQVVIANLAGLTNVRGSSPALTPDPNPNMFWVSSINNPRKFTTEAAFPAELSGFDFVYDDGGPITGLCGARDHLIIFKRSSIWRVDQGGAFGLQKRPVAREGCLYPNSIVRAGNDVYFWGAQGPTVLRNGQQAIPLGEGRVSRRLSDSGWPVLKDVDSFSDPLYNVLAPGGTAFSGCYSMATGCVIWVCTYGGNSLDAVTGASGVNDSLTYLLCYNIATDRFSYLLDNVWVDGNGAVSWNGKMVLAAPLDFDRQRGLDDVLIIGNNAAAGGEGVGIKSPSDTRASVFALPSGVGLDSVSNLELTTGFLQIGGEQRARITGIALVATNRQNQSMPSFSIDVISRDDVSAEVTGSVITTALSGSADRRGFLQFNGDVWSRFKVIRLNLYESSGANASVSASLAEIDGFEVEYLLEPTGRGQH